MHAAWSIYPWRHNARDGGSIGYFYGDARGPNFIDTRRYAASCHVTQISDPIEWLDRRRKDKSALVRRDHQRFPHTRDDSQRPDALDPLEEYGALQSLFCPPIRRDARRGLVGGA